MSSTFIDHISTQPGGGVYSTTIHRIQNGCILDQLDYTVQKDYNINNGLRIHIKGRKEM